MNCQHPLCTEPARYGCDICNTKFCRDHGSLSMIVAQIETSVCWKCGGFNVDAE